MRRFVDPAVLVFIAALIGSLGFHLPVYEVLGVLADELARRDDERAERARRRNEAGADVEMEVVVEPPAEEEPEPTPTPRRPRDVAHERERARVAAVVPTPPPPVPAVVTPPPPVRPPPPPEPAEPEHAVTQRSRDPNVEPPPDARFAAEENSRVEEETVARERNMITDDPEPEPSPSERASEETDDPGEEDEVVAEHEDREGEQRRPTESASSEPSRLAAAASAPAGGAPERSPERSASEPEAREGGGEDSQYETLTIRDAHGTFVVRRPRANGAGEGNAGGRAVAGTPGRRRVEEGGRESPRTGRGRGSVDLRVGYAQLEDIVGREALEEERRAYAEQRRSRRRGTDHAESWRRFRAAIENFVPNVRTGNQTALNARASPFAAYTAEVHRRLHGPFHDFLFGVASNGALANPELETKLEIVLNRDGTIHEVGVVRQSGQILFDHGAFAAVHAGAPYPTAPDAILSGDGRVYLRWTFKRAEPFCLHTQAERYILDNAPSDAAPGRTGSAPAHGPAVVPATPASTPADGAPHGERRAPRAAALPRSASLDAPTARRAPGARQRSSGGSA